MASEPGFYPEFSGFLQYFLAGFAQEPIQTKVNIDTDRARQASIKPTSYFPDSIARCLRKMLIIATATYLGKYGTARLELLSISET